MKFVLYARGPPGVPFSFFFCFVQNYCNVFLCFKIFFVSLQNFPALVLKIM